MRFITSARRRRQNRVLALVLGLDESYVDDLPGLRKMSADRVFGMPSEIVESCCLDYNGVNLQPPSVFVG